VWDASPTSIAALGDSISRGYDACSPLADCPAVSWATGTRASVRSLADRLAVGHAWNLAVSGARMADLPGQAERAARSRPALVTVEIGANDACRPAVADMTPVAAFRSGFTAAMRTLHRLSPKTEVYVASIPDLYRLWSVGRTDPLWRQIWRLGICPSMLGDPMGVSAADSARRAAVRTRVAAYNGVLAQVCAAFPRCRYDGGAVYRQAFTTAELSRWDWFHPSAAGQAALARLAYAGVERPDSPATH
jgi:lysophospholipase L1-like esterase